MKYAEFVEQYGIKNTEFAWETKFIAACLDLYDTTEDLTLQQYLIAWTAVTTEATNLLLGK